MVEVYGDGTSASPQANAVSAGWVGGWLTVPYTADFSQWEIVNSNSDSSSDSWSDEEEYTWTVQDNGATIAYEWSDVADSADEWAVSPRLQ